MEIFFLFAKGFPLSKFRFIDKQFSQKKTGFLRKGDKSNSALNTGKLLLFFAVFLPKFMHIDVVFFPAG